MSFIRQPSAFARYLLSEELQESINRQINDRKEPSRIFDAIYGKPHPQYDDIQSIRLQFLTAYEQNKFGDWKERALYKTIQDLFEASPDENNKMAYKIRDDVYDALNVNGYLDHYVKEFGMADLKVKLLNGYYATFFADDYYFKQVQDRLPEEQDARDMAIWQFTQKEQLSHIKEINDKNIDDKIKASLPKNLAPATPVKKTRFDVSYQPIQQPHVPDMPQQRMWGRMESPFLTDHIEENSPDLAEASSDEESSASDLLNNPNAFDDSFLHRESVPQNDVLPEDPEFRIAYKQPNVFERNWWVFAGYGTIALLTGATIAACFLFPPAAAALGAATTAVASAVGISVGAIATAALAAIGTAIAGVLTAAVFSVGVIIRGIVSAVKGDKPAPAPVLEGRTVSHISESLSNKSSPNSSPRTESTSSVENSPARVESPAPRSPSFLVRRRYSLGEKTQGEQPTSSSTPSKGTAPGKKQD